jgi:hypothetical protein
MPRCHGEVASVTFCTLYLLIIMKDVAGELERRASNRRKLITA